MSKDKYCLLHSQKWIFSQRRITVSRPVSWRVWIFIYKHLVPLCCQWLVMTKEFSHFTNTKCKSIKNQLWNKYEKTHFYALKHLFATITKIQRCWINTLTSVITRNDSNKTQITRQLPFVQWHSTFIIDCIF